MISQIPRKTIGSATISTPERAVAQATWERAKEKLVKIKPRIRTT